MRKICQILLLMLGLIAMTWSAHADPQQPKVMVLDFQLDDRTDLPNAPQELERIRYLTEAFKKKISESGVIVVPVNDKLKTTMSAQSPTYLFERVELAAELAEGSGADYLLIDVALKPTYLFVYPRILLVDIKTKKVVMAKASQLESSWSDQNTTARTGEKLGEMVAAKLKELGGTQK